jgi:hypothetical protein
MNEVQITESEFTTVKNVQALAKDAINSASRQMLQQAQEWPFLLTTTTQTLTAGTSTYDFATDHSKADWDTFYIRQLTSENNTPKKLKLITFDQYITYYRPLEEVGGESARTDPDFVYMTQEEKFGLYPVPNAAYVIEYRYFKFPADLTAASDTSIIPDRFKHVLIDGAMMYMMLFRSNEQSASMHSQKFEQGIDMMRRLLLDYPINVISTAINKPTSRITTDGF